MTFISEKQKIFILYVNQQISFSAEVADSNYEAFLTNKKTFKGNKTIATTFPISMVITSFSLLLTDLIIKYFVKPSKKAHKPTIQNTLKCKTLNLPYGFGLLGLTLLHLIIVHFESKECIVQYTISIVFNTMHGSFIVANKDTLTYLSLNKEAWHDQRK